MVAIGFYVIELPWRVLGDSLSTLDHVSIVNQLLLSRVKREVF